MGNKLSKKPGKDNENVNDFIWNSWQEGAEVDFNANYFQRNSQNLSQLQNHVAVNQPELEERLMIS